MEIIKDSYFTIGIQGKPSLVLIHGLASNKFTWNAIIEILKDDYFIIAVDLPGHGSNSIYETDFSYSSMVDYLFKLQSHLEISFQYIAGHSYGASISTMTALDKPTIVLFLIIACDDNHLLSGENSDMTRILSVHFTSENSFFFLKSYNP